MVGVVFKSIETLVDSAASVGSLFTVFDVCLLCVTLFGSLTLSNYMYSCNYYVFVHLFILFIDLLSC